MGNTQKDVVRSTCGICLSSCGVLIHRENGSPTIIEGDPECPVNNGVLCAKGLASLKFLYHPDRLRHPLRRIGARGKGIWQQVSWDEALNIVAQEFIKAKHNQGAESIAMIQGSAKGLQDSYFTRFANAFGTPNQVWQGHVCFLPRRLASEITCGFYPIPDTDYPPACIVIWGYNMAETRIAEYNEIRMALSKGSKLLVIDPRNIKLAQKAALWLQLRPGTDLALALGMIHVIIHEKLYDKTFVDRWTVGFDELKTHVQDYTPEKVEKITWLAPEMVREAARFYSSHKPACIHWGNAIDQNLNSFQTARSISILRAITGNLGVPGGEVQWSQVPVLRRTSPELRLQNIMPKEKWQIRAGADLNLLPLFPFTVPQSIVKAILQEDPYPILAAYVQGCNPLLTWGNARNTYESLNKLTFLVVSDLFMTPTAALADIVLPSASYLEFNSLVEAPRYARVQIQQKVAEVDECWSDYRILSTLAKKLNLEEYFWESEEQCLDAILKPAGLTFEEFKKIGSISGTKQYRNYEAKGFETPSRKVELFSSQLDEWGFAPLPTYCELPETPYSSPDLVKEYPLIFTTWKSTPFQHSGGRQIVSLRDIHPEPVVSIHPETAFNLGIKEGDWIYIETKRGRIKQKAKLTSGLDPRVIGIDYGWWFPESRDSNLYDWERSNVNVLTDDNPPYNLEMGSSNLRGTLCKVYKG